LSRGLSCAHSEATKARYQSELSEYRYGDSKGEARGGLERFFSPYAILDPLETARDRSTPAPTFA
jgi:hypothetical protein